MSERARRPLLDALEIERGDLISIVGGGGKSSLLFAIARQAPMRVVATTTTRIFAAQIDLAPESCEAASPQLAAALARGTSGLLVIGAVEGEKAKGVERDVPARLLAHPEVDLVVVEADGSRMRPTKAPAPHEPVVASETTKLIVVAGLDALEGPIEERCHRPELVSALTGIPRDRPLDEGGLAKLLSDEAGGLRGAPERARVIIVLNKVESEATLRRAREVARRVLESARVDRVLMGSLHAGGDALWEIARP